MSDLNVMATLLETRLATITPKWAIAFGASDLAEPVPMTKGYLRCWVLFSDPADYALAGGVGRERGTFQVNVNGPGLDDGPALERAQLIRNAFVPPLKLTQGDTLVKITGTASIAPGYRDGDRWIRPVSIPFTNR